MLADPLTYPFRRNNAKFLVMGTAFLSIPPLVALALPTLPYVGIIALLVESFVLCTVLVYFQNVMEASTRGDEDLPAWPDEADVQSLAGRAFQVIIPLVLSFLPLIALIAVTVFRTGEWALKGASLWIGLGLFAQGFLYLPIALLIYSFYGELAVLNVIGGVRSIARIGRDYAIVALFVAALFGLHAAVAWGLARAPLIVSVPAGAFLFFYAMLGAMRAVGLLYARHRDRLGWEL